MGLATQEFLQDWKWKCLLKSVKVACQIVELSKYAFRSKDFIYTASQKQLEFGLIESCLNLSPDTCCVTLDKYFNL